MLPSTVRSLLPSISRPAVRVSWLLTVVELERTTPVELVLLIVRLLKVVDAEPPIVCSKLPLKVTVPVLGVNAPLLVQLPETARELEPEMVRVAPLSIVILRQRPPAAPMIG